MEAFHWRQSESGSAESFELVARCRNFQATVRRPEDEHGKRTGHRQK
jgi:hypothetical protein